MDNAARAADAKISGDSVKTVESHAIEEPIHASAAIGPAMITPEIVAVIEAAVTAFTGKKLRVVSVKTGSEHKVASSSWTAQGREMIHESHNVVQRGH